jgi:hypothetical protein
VERERVVRHPDLTLTPDDVLNFRRRATAWAIAKKAKDAGVDLSGE